MEEKTMFTELTLTEMNEIDGGNPILTFAKRVLEKILLDEAVKAVKSAYNELKDPNHYIGKPDYRTWLN
jgi:hypothetical protein